MKKHYPQELIDKIDQIQIQTTLANNKFLTSEETSKLLGISKTYLYELTWKRVIPFYKPSGKKLLFKHSDLMNWIEKSRHDSTNDILNQMKTV